MDLPDYQPPNDAVGLALIVIIAIVAGLSMKFVVDTWGDTGELLVLPIFLLAIAILTYLSPD